MLKKNFTGLKIAHMSKSKATELYDFIAKTKPSHLTLDDIKKWPVNHIVEVVCWENGFEDAWLRSDEAEEGQFYDPQEFFDYNKCTIVNKGDFVWEIQFPTKKDYEGPIDVNISKDLETKYTWYPLDSDKVLRAKSVNGKKIEIPMSLMPPTTRIGYNGPMMLWSKLPEFGKVYFEKQYMDPSDSEESSDSGDDVE